MGSVGNPNSWPPYDTTSCSQGICTLYCPQYCYFFFPPRPADRDRNDDDSDSPFSPLVIAVIVLLSTALIFATYYTVVTKYCRRRIPIDNDTTIIRLEESHDQTGFDQWPAASHGLDDATIKTIAVCKYRRGDALIDGSECAVCLSEFHEDESLRLLPKCSHAFHLPCIDTWLRSHSSCPLCRASVIVVAHAPVSPPVLPPLPMEMDAGESQPSDEVILTVEADDHGTGARDDQEGFKGLRRSVSLGPCSSKSQGLISDDDALQVGKGKGKDQIGSSKGFEAQRCFSTGSLMFAVDDDHKGKNSLFLR